MLKNLMRFLYIVSAVFISSLHAQTVEEQITHPVYGNAIIEKSYNGEQLLQTTTYTKNPAYTQGNEEIGEVVIYDEDGMVSSKGGFIKKQTRETLLGGSVDRVRHGSWSIYEKGKLILTFSYIEDSREGEFQAYHENGKPRYIGQFKSDRQSGITDAYFNDGQLHNSVEYLNNKKKNVIAFFDRQGNQISHGSFKDGNGTLDIYDLETGEVDKTITYDDGVVRNYEIETIETDKGIVTVKTYRSYSDDLISKIERTLNGKLEGLQEIYGYKGRIDEKINYSKGVKHGLHERFNDDGTLFYAYTYVQGVKKGPYKREPEGIQDQYYALEEGVYDEDGEKTGKFTRYLSLKKDVVGVSDVDYKKIVVISGEYNKGIKVGTWRYFDPDERLTKEVTFSDETNPIYTDKEYHKGSKQLESEVEYNDKTKRGFKKYFYLSGKLEVYAEYKDNKPHGVYKSYFENGQLHQVGQRKDRDKIGRWKTYDPDGLILKDYTYTEFSSSFAFKKIDYNYNDEGKLKSVITRDNLNKNKNDGVYRYADTLSKYYNVENGSLKEIKTEKQFEYENGNAYEKEHGLYQYYTSDGKLETDGNYNKGEKHGVWKSYHSDDLLRELTTYENGERLGAFEDHEYYKNNTKSKSVVGVRSSDRTSQKITYFYENGQIKETGDYLRVYTKGSKRNGREGEWKSYYENGNLKSVNRYLKGDKHGDWKSYYENGDPISIAHYVEGAKHGEWKLYYESGFPEETGRYVNGLEQGEWVYYYENNKIQSTGAYLPLNDKTAHLIDELEEAKEGVWKYFDENEKLIEQTTFQVSDDYQYLVKEQKKYGENGKLKSEATFHNEVVAGTHKEYFESGALKYKTVFGDNNECIGEDFYEDGVLERFTQYYCEDSELTPKVAKQYHENGKLLIEVTYDEYGDVLNLLQYFGFNGEPLEIGTLKDGSGTVNIYNDDNELIRVDTYKNGDLVK